MQKERWISTIEEVLGALHDEETALLGSEVAALERATLRKIRALSSLEKMPLAELAGDTADHIEIAALLGQCDTRNRRNSAMLAGRQTRQDRSREAMRVGVLGYGKSGGVMADLQTSMVHGVA